MTDKEREEELVKCLTDLRSRHNRLLMKYIELEDDYFDLKEKLDVMADIRRKNIEYRTEDIFKRCLPLDSVVENDIEYRTENLGI